MIGGLALGELELLTRTWLTVFLTLFLAWIAAQEADFLQGGTELLVLLAECAGDGKADRTNLTRNASALDGNFDIKLVGKLGFLEWLENRVLKCDSGHIVLKGTVVDFDPSAARGDPDVGN